MVMLYRDFHVCMWWWTFVAQKDRLRARWLVSLNTYIIYMCVCTNRIRCQCQCKSMHISMDKPRIILLKMLKWPNILSGEAKFRNMDPAHSWTPLKIEKAEHSLFFVSFFFSGWNHLLNGHYKRNKISITSQIDWCICSKEIRTPFCCTKREKNIAKKRNQNGFIVSFCIQICMR